MSAGGEAVYVGAVDKTGTDKRDFGVVAVESMCDGEAFGRTQDLGKSELLTMGLSDGRDPQRRTCKCGG